MGSYVAMTRVEHRKQLLIYRPFDRRAFQQGQLEGPVLLLKHLRGELSPEHWKAIEAEHTPKAICSGCGIVKYKPEFAPQQWSKKSKRPFCKACVHQSVQEGKPLECSFCGTWQAEEVFSPEQRHPNKINTRVCTHCQEGATRMCKECKMEKRQNAFTSSEWTKTQWSSSGQGRCTECRNRQREPNACSKCKKA